MDLTKTQKIILIIIAAIVILAGCYYIYSEDKEDNLFEESQTSNMLEVNESNQEEEQYSDSTIIVHVSGAVNNEGIVELKIESRISDAIEKAGGLREDAYVDKINLAYKLEDGMKIYIPNANEKEKFQDLTEENNYITSESGLQLESEQQQNNNTSTSSTQSSNKKININNATQADLENLPGIGAATAQKIISYRQEKGKFNSIEDIKNVKGIGDSKYDSIKDLISVK